MFGKLASKVEKFAEKTTTKIKGAVRGVGHQGNERNEATVQEMKVFKENVKDLVKELQECAAKITSTTTVMARVMSVQLPRAFSIVTDAAPGTVEPYDQELHLVGTGVNTQTLLTVVQAMQTRVTDEVVRPLEKWLQDYSAIKDRNHKCEALVQELNAQRKSANAAEENAKDLHAKGHKNAESAQAKAQSEREKERKLEEQFIAMEADIYRDMLTSIKEILELRRYALAALQAYQVCMAQSVSCFEVDAPIVMRLPRAEPLPPLSTSSYVSAESGDASSAGGAPTSSPSVPGGQPPVQYSPYGPPLAYSGAPQYYGSTAPTAPGAYPPVPTAPPAPSAPPAPGGPPANPFVGTNAAMWTGGAPK